MALNSRCPPGGGAVAALVEAVGTRVAFSNRQKPFFPAAGLTKGDLIEYYAAVAPVLLPHLAQRPVILERYPDGIDGKQFFQWRPPASSPSWLGTIEIPEHRPGRVRGADKQAKRAFVLNDVESLLYVANLGCIPLHLLAVDVGDFTACQFATVDFDVKQASLDQARPLVRELRRILEHAGLPSFLKSSGKSGVHVLVPLGSGIPFAPAQALVDFLGGWLAARFPHAATREGTIAKRGARVYLDTGQTGAIRAIAAPYSVRPVQDARVSMPLDWSELDTFDPAAFTVRTVPAMTHHDPWHDFRVQTPDFPLALARLRALAEAESGG